jgi:DNA-binding GntR family transcriptional regulator
VVEVLARQTSPDGVARYIRGLIVEGVLRQGDRVPREEIATALGVSQIPLREAIVALDREGWVTIEPHRGAFVHGVDEEWVRDHHDLLGAIYALVAQRASTRAGDEELAELEELSRALDDARDVDTFEAVNDRLMRRLIEVAHSPRLTAALRGVTSIIPGNFFAVVPDAVEPQRRALTAVVDAVVARDGTRAADEFEALPAIQSRAVIAVLSARGVLVNDGVS